MLLVIIEGFSVIDCLALYVVREVQTTYFISVCDNPIGFNELYPLNVHCTLTTYCTVSNFSKPLKPALSWAASAA